LTHPIVGVPPPPTAAALLVGLTPEQAQAVTHGERPLLLIAGPGAGKTRTLIYRVAHLFDSDLARPEEVLVVTFSVRAASELRLRLADLLGQDRARAVIAATFHSVCARLLRKHAHLFGPDRALHDLRPGRHAPGDRLDSGRRRTRPGPGGTRPLRAAAVGRGAGGDLAAERAGCSIPRPIWRRWRTDRAAGRCRVARERRGAAASDAWSFDDLLVGEAIAAGVPGPESLILARTGYATQPAQLALARAGIPRRVLGSLALYAHAKATRPTC